MTDENEPYEPPTQAEYDAALKPGSKFWQEFGAHMASEVLKMKARAEHPAIVAMQEDLRQLLRQAALQQPEVLALVAAARACVKGTTYAGQDGTYKLYVPPSPTEIAALEVALKALEESVR